MMEDPEQNKPCYYFKERKRTVSETYHIHPMFKSFTEFEQLEDVKDIIKMLVVESKILEDLTGIEVLENLEELLVPDNNIVDISPLQHLKKLRLLNIEQNYITDITPLKELHNIETLIIYKNAYTDEHEDEFVANLPEYFPRIERFTSNRYHYSYIDKKLIKHEKETRPIYACNANKDFLFGDEMLPKCWITELLVNVSKELRMDMQFIPQIYSNFTFVEEERSFTDHTRKKVEKVELNISNNKDQAVALLAAEVYQKMDDAFISLENGLYTPILNSVFNAFQKFGYPFRRDSDSYFIEFIRCLGEI